MIPFTQYLLPNGRKQITEIERPEHIEKMANVLITNGAVFEIEILTTGEIHMDCSMPDFYPNDPDLANPLSLELCENGPAVLVAVDKLVSDCFEHWQNLTQTKG